MEEKIRKITLDELLQLKRIFPTVHDVGVLKIFHDEIYSQILSIPQKPIVGRDNLESFFSETLAYIIQRLKLWNGRILYPQNISALVCQEELDISYDFERDSSDEDEIVSPESAEPDYMLQHPVSRLDYLACILNMADFFVANDILRIISMFPQTLPFIVPDICSADKYIVTLPYLQNLTTKWESTPGEIVQNHLFSSPFKMVVALRLGTNKIGKSTILNQLMSERYMFSSRGQPGCEYGRPNSLGGSVEIVWLTQETCSDPTWKPKMVEYYKGNPDRVAILANLHGEATKYPDTIKYLEHFCSTFLVFVMPDSATQQLEQLRSLVSDSELLAVYVNQKGRHKKDPLAVRTATLLEDGTLSKIRNLVRRALDSETQRKLDSPPPTCGASLHYIDCFVVDELETFLKHVRQHGCSAVKRDLTIILATRGEDWKREIRVKTVIDLFLRILNISDVYQRKKCLMQLETELSKLSTIESKESVKEVIAARDSLREIVARSTSRNQKDDIELQQAKIRLKSAEKQADDTNLGQEHFFRALGHIYTNRSGNQANSSLASRYADLLISGHAIELLNGDVGEIALSWIKAICAFVKEKRPNLKVFVISIIGLQSSGKSTLLNALFSCRFAVSVGRCSRGLFMRMVFLTEDLRKSCGFDAIILIDTEGLASPEKINDTEASKKDRMMATYAMGVSNLTIVNINGEVMNEMTEILQIAVVAMARLREGGIKPDVIMVQHLPERNTSKLEGARAQFCEAIHSAFKLIRCNDIEIGASGSECLNELARRLQSGDLFHYFGPFKDGSSVNSPPSESYHDDVLELYKALLHRTKSVTIKHTFNEWTKIFECYWTCVKEENFALNFKNVQRIFKFLGYEKNIANLKDRLDRAFRRHADSFSEKFTYEVYLHAKKNSATPMNTTQLEKEVENDLNKVPESCPGHCKACSEYTEEREKLLEDMQNSEDAWEEDTKILLDKYRTTAAESNNKNLKLTLEGIVYRETCLSQFSTKITAELKKAHLKELNNDEKKQISTSILETIKQEAERLSVEDSLADRMNKALNEEFRKVLPRLCREFDKEITETMLRQHQTGHIKNASGSSRNMPLKLEELQFRQLLDEVNALSSKMLDERRPNYVDVGIKFEQGMVSSLKTSFPTSLQTFETRFNVTLDETFKITVQICLFQQFKLKMDNLEQMWNRRNKPIHIFWDKQAFYLEQIQMKLDHGFSCISSGNDVALNLIEVIKARANTVASRLDLTTLMENLAEIDLDNCPDNISRESCMSKSEPDRLLQDLSQIDLASFTENLSWAFDSETIRIKFFRELADEVRRGDNKRALQHFSNPKKSIEDWILKNINSPALQEKTETVYKSTLKNEIDRILIDISGSKNLEDIATVVKKYNVHLSADSKTFEFLAFKESIVRRLKTFSDIPIQERVKIHSVSRDSVVLRRLGCTEFCFWCGALCWRSQNHQLTYNTKSGQHGLCHQPAGLMKTKYINSKELISKSCHEFTNDTTVYFGQYTIANGGIKWEEAKSKHFYGWNFDGDSNTELDKLMRWFFFKLHKVIAKEANLNEATPAALEFSGCTEANSNIEAILNNIDSDLKILKVNRRNKILDLLQNRH